MFQASTSLSDFNALQPYGSQVAILDYVQGHYSAGDHDELVLRLSELRHHLRLLPALALISLIVFRAAWFEATQGTSRVVFDSIQGADLNT
jgi:hypothetical protein